MGDLTTSSTILLFSCAKKIFFAQLVKLKLSSTNSHLSKVLYFGSYVTIKVENPLNISLQF